MLSKIMQLAVLIYLCFAIGEIEAQIFRSACKKDVTFKLVARNSRLNSTGLQHSHVTTLSLCAKLCLDNTTCSCINYHPAMQLCELLKQPKDVVGIENLIPSSGWKHYEPTKNQVRHIFSYPDSF